MTQTTTTTRTTNNAEGFALGKIIQEVSRDANNFATYRRTCSFIMNSTALSTILGNTKPEYMDFTLNMIVTGANTDPLKLSEKQRAAIQRVIQFNLATIARAYMDDNNAAAEVAANEDSEVVERCATLASKRRR